MIEIRPLDHCDAAVVVPGSKSYTHRTLIVSALADGESILINALRSVDTEYTIQGLERLGVQVVWKGDTLHVQGKGGNLTASEEIIFVGNSGTSMRFLTGLAALRKGPTLLDGDERMRKRPIGALLEGLEGLGVRAYSKEGDGYPPVIVEPDRFEGGLVKIKGGESSQFLSALLMIAPFALRDVSVEVIGDLVSTPYVDMTRDVMAAFDVKVESEGYRSFFVRSGQRYLPQRYQIEGDASHASYFFSAAAICRGRVRVENFNPASVQGDTSFLNILERMGCDVYRGNDWAEVVGKKLQGIEIDMNRLPDLVPTLSVTAAFAQGKTLIRNIGHLRFKESDRIQTLTQELNKLGIPAEGGEDWLIIDGGEAHGAEIDPHEDHRLAMSFAMAGLAIPGITIKGEHCVNKSFPKFWETLKGLYR